jgi:hypothetical protein
MTIPTLDPTFPEVILADWERFITHGFAWDDFSDRLFQFFRDKLGRYERYWRADKTLFWQQHFGRTTTALVDFIADLATTPQGLTVHNPAWYDRFDEPDWGGLYAAMVAVMDQYEEALFEVIEAYESDLADQRIEPHLAAWRSEHPQATPAQQEDAAQTMRDEAYDYYDAVGYPIDHALRRQIAKMFQPDQPTRLTQPALFGIRPQATPVAPPPQPTSLHHVADSPQVTRQTQPQRPTPIEAAQTHDPTT